MYNRYIPQPDGSHQRNRVPDPRHTDPQQAASVPETPAQAFSPPLRPLPPKNPTDGILSMLRNLLPKNLDSGDLIILLLLLLMANDCEENRNHALLTLALYFFL